MRSNNALKAIKLYTKHFYLSLGFAFACFNADAQPKAKNAEPSLCENVKEFATLPHTNPRAVTFSSSIDSDGSRKTECSSLEGDDSAKKFCAFLSRRLSAEFMDHNLSSLSSCLAKNVGFTGKDVGVQELSGKLTFYQPFPDAEDTVVDLTFRLTSAIGGESNYIVLTAR